MATKNKNVALLAHLKRRSGYGTDTRRNTLKFSKKVRNYFPLGEKKVLIQKYFFSREINMTIKTEKQIKYRYEGAHAAAWACPAPCES